MIDKGNPAIVGKCERHAAMQIHSQCIALPQVGIDVVVADVHEHVIHHHDVVHTAKPVPRRKKCTSGKAPAGARSGNRFSSPIMLLQQCPELRMQVEAEPRLQLDEPLGVRWPSQHGVIGGRVRMEPRLKASPLTLERRKIHLCHALNIDGRTDKPAPC